MGQSCKLAGVGDLPNVTVCEAHHLAHSALSSRDVGIVKLFAEVSPFLRRPHLAEK